MEANSAICIQPIICSEAEHHKQYNEKIHEMHQNERRVYYNKIMEAQKSRGEAQQINETPLKITIMITRGAEDPSMMYTYLKKYSLNIQMIRLEQAKRQLDKHYLDKQQFDKLCNDNHEKINIIDVLGKRISHFTDALKSKETLLIIDQTIKLLSSVYLSIIVCDPDLGLKNGLVISVDQPHYTDCTWDVFSTVPFISLINAAFSKLKENQACLYHLLVIMQLLDSFGKINFINTYECLNSLHEAKMNNTAVEYKKLLHLNFFQK
jgi:hypothetical protein